MAAFLAGLLLSAGGAQAQAPTSGTWLGGTGDYNLGSNWNGAVPDNTGGATTDPGGTATFGSTGQTSIDITSSVMPGTFLFNSGAPAYTFSIGSNAIVDLNGSGITNNSSSTQTINVTDGTLNFDNSATAGNAHINVDGATSFLQFQDNSSAGSGTFTVTNGGFMCFCNDATTGTANITIDGSASVLQFENTTQMGNATVTASNGGTVKFLFDGVTSLGRYISNSGILDVTSVSTVGIGSIEGSGSVHLDSAELTVGGNNNSTTYSGVIDGSGGSLVKTGTGTFTLSGANLFDGGTTVNQGTLMLTGSLASGVTVNNGGTFGGTGTITGDLVNSGTVAPGTPGSPLTINGTFTQNSGGIYQVAVNSSGATKLVVNGTANLAGSVSVQAGNGYTAGTRYTILTATSIAGTFSGATSNLAFLTPTLSYDSTDAYLTLALAGNAFQRAATTGNQSAVGAVLDRAFPTATGDFAAVLNVISGLDTIQGPHALDVIGGQNYSGFSTVATQSATAFMNNFAMLGGGGQAPNNNNRSTSQASGGAGRIALADACEFDSECDAAQPSRWGAWGGGIGSFGTVAGDTGAHGTTYSLGGFSGGLDYRFNPNVLAGVTAGYSSATLYTQGINGNGLSNTVQLGLYSELTSGPAYLDLLGGYAHGDNRMWRPIVIPGLQPRTAQGQTQANQFFGQVEGGWRFELGGAAAAFVTPFARLQASTSTQAAFSEAGADSLDLNVQAQTTNSLRSVLGTQLGGDLDAGWRDRIHAVFRLGWSHEYADTSRPVTASFAGAPALSFTTLGAAAPRDGAIVGLGATTAIADATTIFLRYDGDLEGGNTAHTLSAGVRVVW